MPAPDHATAPSPLRVLHLTAGLLAGGIEKILVTLVRERQHAPAMETVVGLCFAGPVAEELRSLDATVHVLGAVHARRPWTVWKARRALAALLREQHFDVVICHSPWVHAVFATTVRRAGRPLVFWMHAQTNGRHWSERWASATPPDLAIAGSHAVATEAATMFPAAPAQVFYAPMPLPATLPGPEARDEVRREMGVDDATTVIIQVGRMEPLKGQGLHLEALARLRDEPGWTAWFVGGVQRPEEQAYYDALRAQATALGVDDRIRWLGERRDVPRLLAAADVFCQPNQWSEGLSIVWIEAFLMSLPIVTMRLGTAPEFIGDIGGILVPPGDVGALAEALRALARDPARRQALGRAGNHRVWELCAPATQMPRLYRLLEDARRNWQAPTAPSASSAAQAPARPTPAARG